MENLVLCWSRLVSLITEETFVIYSGKDTVHDVADLYSGTPRLYY
jgi:hypothetical protein